MSWMLFPFNLIGLGAWQAVALEEKVVTHCPTRGARVRHPGSHYGRCTHLKLFQRL